MFYMKGFPVKILGIVSREFQESFKSFTVFTVGLFYILMLK